MASTASQIIALALEGSHSGPGKTLQAQIFFNQILHEVCQTYDMAAARGQFFFNLNPALASPNSQFIGSRYGSGPYPMPVDYLRLSGSSGSSGSQRSFIWYLNGVPYPIIPCDLGEFDMQVQQAGLNSYVWLAASDMSTPLEDRIILSTTGTLASGSNQITSLASLNRIAAPSPPVMGVAGTGITPGTMIIGINSSMQSATMSAPATLDQPNASLLFGYPPSIYVYPPPSSGQPAMIRYQRRMPDMFDLSRYPWFTNDGYLYEKLLGKLCSLNDDSRADRLLGGPAVPGSPDAKLTAWLAAKDDEPSHPKRVELDRRRFGTPFRTLPSTKTVGW